MTAPTLTVVPETTSDDDEVVHTWCSKCGTNDPMISVCGIDLTEHDQAEPGTKLPRCPMCKDLWPQHAAALHPELIAFA